MTTMTLTATGTTCDAEPAGLPRPELEAAVDGATERLVVAAATRGAPIPPRRTALEARATTESQAWVRWWRRFEPVCERKDLPAIRGLILGLMAGYGLARLIEGVPDRSLTRRVCDVVCVLHRLRALGEHELVAELANLALRRLRTDEALVSNPGHWAWDAAEDLKDLSSAVRDSAIAVG